jgi:c-di-GMP phosphodiesterase Gmr
MQADFGELIEGELGRLRLLVNQLRQSEAASRHLCEELQKRAYTDELTGLPNRARLRDHVESMLRSPSPPARFALAFIQLQNFKHINDFYTSPIGEELLRKVAHRIAGGAQVSEMLARTGTDEFGLLIASIDNDAHLHARVKGLAVQLQEPFHIEGFEIFTSASIGVSISPEHGKSYEELRRNAESALYRAQNSAVATAIFFDTSMHQSRQARMQIEQRLRLAIRDMQFRCAFQPKVDIRTREVIGFETLIRWCDDDGEIHAPQNFVKLAAELGVINPMTHFVLREAIESMGSLEEQFGPDKSISINVAAKQAGDVSFMRGLLDTLAQSGFAQSFIFEVTEDAFIATRDFQTTILPMLRELGVRVSIDDFGTGYSSLSVLADITADEIKIDRAFISNIHQRPRSQSILRAIESVSQAIGMAVIAEGVESYEELAYLLAATRIRYAQGYYFAKPFLLDEIVKTSGARGNERIREAARPAMYGRTLSTTRMSGLR